MPPCPGIIFPLSFMPAIRLNLDSIKSPIVPNIPTINAMLVQIKIDFPLKLGLALIYNFEIKNPVKIANTTPPINP